ncbi:ENTH/VHS [Parasponia andersonii]|uniref:ENTH/VHS n=1 Tax=Parasponia andersonii TaxID=3476 RepID=A0A2P5DQG9_PARAD|nr:ENTH/VHS [Parasponia andersonii]
MDSSRRVVESYWRSRMIDGATFDEDKVTPVYKLEEICDLLRSFHLGIVKELSDITFDLSLRFLDQLVGSRSFEAKP